MKLKGKVALVTGAGPIGQEVDLLSGFVFLQLMVVLI